MVEQFKFGQTKEQVAQIIQDNFSDLQENKVDVVAGKQLSTNDFTNEYKTKLDGIEAGAEVNVIETVAVNGSALPVSGKKVDVSVPITTQFTLEYVGSTGVLSLKYGGVVLSSQNLPLEMVVQSGYYDQADKELVLVLNNGTEIRINAADLVDEYNGDGTTITLDTASGANVFKIADAVMQRITTAETNISSLTSRVSTLESKTIGVTQKSFTTTDSSWTALSGDGTYSLTISTGTQKRISPVYNTDGKEMFVQCNEASGSVILTVAQKFSGYFYVL